MIIGHTGSLLLDPERLGNFAVGQFLEVPQRDHFLIQFRHRLQRLLKLLGHFGAVRRLAGPQIVEDTVEFFCLIGVVNLTETEKKELVEFMRDL